MSRCLPRDFLFFSLWNLQLIGVERDFSQISSWDGRTKVQRFSRVGKPAKILCVPSDNKKLGSFFRKFENGAQGNIDFFVLLAK